MNDPEHFLAIDIPVRRRMRYRLDTPETRGESSIKRMERSLALDLLGLVAQVVVLAGALGYILGVVAPIKGCYANTKERRKING
jgi:predicted DNA-binding transcriptional regulator